MPNHDPTRKDASDNKPSGFSRRSFIQSMGLSAAAGAIGAHAESAIARADEEMDVFGPDPGPMTLTVNGNRVDAVVDPATTLLDLLRHQLNLTGTKEICDRGACGGCSVMVDGVLVNSCMYLACDARGAKVTTIEGIGTPEKLDPIQEAFVRHDALQCGYCTPGLVMACKALLAQRSNPTLDEIKAGLCGNICRCGTYSNVFNAVLEVTGQLPVVDQES